MSTLLQINVVANWGSTGRITEEIGQLAIANGWDSYIAYGRGNPTSQSKLIRIGNDWDMYCHVIQSRLFDNHGLTSKKVTKIFIEQIEKIKPDLIHLHNLHGYFINYELLFSYLSKCDIPVIWTLHDCWPFTGHCSYFTYAKCNKWINECCNCPQIHSYPVSLLIDHSRLNYEKKKKVFTSLSNLTLVPVSDWLAALLKKSFLRKYPIRRIYNGVDINTFIPMQKEVVRARLGIKTKYMLIGIANIWSSRKGLNDFIALRNELSEEYTIILIGLNYKQIKKLPTGIIGIPRTSSIKELVEYYSAADIFVNPTWEDNFPTTNLEALSCGTPVITYCTGGSIEAIDAITGKIVPVGDIDALSQTIIKVCENKNETISSEQCRKRAINTYNKDNCYLTYMELYRKLTINKIKE